MAGENVLAREVIEFVNKNVETVEKQIDGLKQRLTQTDAAAKKAQGSFTALGSTFNVVTSAAAKLAAVGTGLIGFFAHGAARDTLEATRLSLAFERLQRTIGDGLAPYIRALTTGLNELSSWFARLDAGLREQLTKWALITAAVAAFVAFLPVIVSVGSTLLGVFSALVSPIGLVAAALGAIGVYLFNLATAGMTLGEKITAGVEIALRAFILLKTGLEGLVTIARGTWTNFYEIIRWAMENAIGFIRYFRDNAKEYLLALGQNFITFFANIGELFAKFGRAAFNWVKSGFKDFQADWSSSMYENLFKGFKSPEKVFAPTKLQLRSVRGDLEEIIAKGREGLAGAHGTAAGITGSIMDIFKKMKTAAAGGAGFQVKMDVGMESLQGVWDRLQKTIADPARLTTEESMLGELQGIHEAIQKAQETYQRFQPTPAVT